MPIQIDLVRSGDNIAFILGKRRTRIMNRELVEIVAEEFYIAGVYILEHTPEYVRPLTQKWLMYKLQMGLDERPWHMTGFLALNFKIWKVGRLVGDPWIVGWDDTIHPPSGLQCCELACYLDKGTERVPPLPIMQAIMERGERKARIAITEHQRRIA